ncbi:hypothetical protein PF010_g22527 [Phytophthora fragariae]|uniref:PX domain-containing protein n=1 Tax=Phytophthora fragariae TaxID=53985 RepID=A0A6A3WWZ2_9STRA|nr:hypothetical protein PF010_g22527 [Phytophthora fragariae]KAE9192599.1 hypothetical protein PF002_g24153 [Phytophthora fragariae]KAE9284438.1 hypothetical protein PF001_g22385 [Phytophthora fragariae]
MRPESDDCSAEQSDDGERRSLDTDLGRRLSQSLSQLSSSAKSAVSLNQISHVAIRAAHNRAERQHGAVVTVYVVEVFLQDVQKGLPKSAETQNKHKLTWRQKPKKQSECADYQVEHRYSSFRLLRQRILDVVSAPSESDTHPLCQGPVATYTGWRQLLVRLRKHGLEKFINELLTAAKDVSYRYTAVQCERYATVPGFLNEFLADSHLRTAVSSTALSCC